MREISMDGILTEFYSNIMCLQNKRKIIKETNYLMYKPEGTDLYGKCNDTKYPIGRK
jgi:hypothetical protein